MTQGGGVSECKKKRFFLLQRHQQITHVSKTGQTQSPEVELEAERKVENHGQELAQLLNFWSSGAGLNRQKLN